MERPMQKLNGLSRSLLPLALDCTLITVIEMSQSSWLVASIVPGVERQPLKKLTVDESALLKLLHRWRQEGEKAGHRIKRITVAFEAGRDGFWLARWLRARDIEVHVIHTSSVAVSREHRRAKITESRKWNLHTTSNTAPQARRNPAYSRSSHGWTSDGTSAAILI